MEIALRYHTLIGVIPFFQGRESFWIVEDVHLAGGVIDAAFCAAAGCHGNASDQQNCPRKSIFHALSLNLRALAAHLGRIPGDCPYLITAPPLRRALSHRGEVCKHHVSLDYTQSFCWLGPDDGMRTIVNNRRITVHWHICR